MLTRRTAIAAGGSALVLAGCGKGPARTLAGDTADLPILGTALELERGLIVLYATGITLLRGRAQALARQVLEHEREHAQALAEVMLELGANAPQPQAESVYRRKYPRSGNAGAWKQNAILAEERAAAGYAAAIPKLANPRLRATFAAIMTSEAEHAVALDVAR